MVRFTPPLPRRGGFTLVELAVVISIIAVLLALGAGAAITVLEGQRASRTEDLLRNTDKLLQQHWRKVVEDARKEQAVIPDSVVALAAGDRNRALVIWIKLRLMEAFPQSYAEIRTPWAYNYIPADMQRYNSSYLKAIKNVPLGPPAPTESAACLYLILRENRGVARLEEDKLTANIIDTDNDGVKELVDAWGNPLTFIRFPIGTNPPGVNPVLSAPLLTELDLLNPNKTAKGQQFGDPEDPDGLLQQSTWSPPGNVQTFTKFIHAVNAAKQQYFTPVLISSGKDGVYNTADDLYSWRLRLGSKGN
jgi:prepilin-type N-terminal cleavage/methylation domain-containing protein